MALHIEDPEVERLARALSDRRGLSVEEAVRVALEEASESRSAIIERWFETRMRPILPAEELGRTMTKAEWEEALGMAD